MSLENLPDVNLDMEKASDVVDENLLDQQVENESSQQIINYADKTLAELIKCFQDILADPQAMKKNKEVEIIKASFYKSLNKEKSLLEKNSDSEETNAEVENNPLLSLEEGFKELYNKYKKSRAEYNLAIEKERQENLKIKEALIEELKNLIDRQEGTNLSFPDFRNIQTRWKETGPVPEVNFRDLNNTYQLYVEQFYDKAQIDREMRDLDFKKNLEAKEELCKEAEALSEKDNIQLAFSELQKLHEAWKELGPVAKEYRESIWERFKEASTIINKKYQTYFEQLKAIHLNNLELKKAICEKIEAIAERVDISTSNEWNKLAKDIETLQAEWRKIGFATKSENQAIYDRFRQACDKFFEKKREFYSDFKNNMNANLELKLDIIAQAEALKDSTEWKSTTDALIALQAKWKEIGAVPRKKSEQIWQRFRAACDAFFENRDKNNTGENNYYANLKAKRALIEEIKTYINQDADKDLAMAEDFAKRWSDIGFVPFKEKDAVANEYKEAFYSKFPDFRSARKAKQQHSHNSKLSKLSDKERLIQSYKSLEQQIATYENNMGFFANASSSSPLVKQMLDKIAKLKSELEDLKVKIREYNEN